MRTLTTLGIVLVAVASLAGCGEEPVTSTAPSNQRSAATFPAASPTSAIPSASPSESEAVSASFLDISYSYPNPGLCEITVRSTATEQKWFAYSVYVMSDGQAMPNSGGTSNMTIDPGETKIVKQLMTNLSNPDAKLSCEFFPMTG